MKPLVREKPFCACRRVASLNFAAHAAIGMDDKSAADARVTLARIERANRGGS
jgi:hypothetical protein